MAKVMTNEQLVSMCKKIATNYKTLYVYGCFGAPMNSTNKKRYSSNYDYNKRADRKKLILAASSDTFGFDCVNLIKGILWGWNGNVNATYGGAKYCSNGVPDVSANGMMDYCTSKSTDFSKIEIGEVVWMNGHIGVYIGDGLAVECTPIWKDGVQITAVGNIGKKTGYNTRTWTSHGKLKFIEYKQPTSFLPPRGWFTKGDTGENVKKIDAWLASLVVGDYYGYYTTEMVKALQAKGKEDGLYNDAIDGNWGAKTEALAEHYGFRP